MRCQYTSEPVDNIASNTAFIKKIPKVNIMLNILLF